MHGRQGEHLAGSGKGMPIHASTVASLTDTDREELSGSRISVSQQPASDAGEEMADQPRPGFLAGRKAIAVTVAMGKVADRRHWVDCYLSLPKEERAGWLSVAKSSTRNVDELVVELTSAVDDA